MHFSLKWLFAVMAYVALAAAAIGSGEWPLASAVWIVTILAFYYALLVCFVSRGRNPAAVGFAILWTANLAALYAAPESVPSSLALDAFGHEVTDKGLLIQLDSVGRRVAARSPMVRAANAAGTMAAGLVGSGLAAVACRREDRASDGPLQSSRPKVE